MQLKRMLHTNPHACSYSCDISNTGSPRVLDGAMVNIDELTEVESQ